METTKTTANEYTYTNGIHVLLSFRSGERALWLEEPNARDDDHMAYTINDGDSRIDLGADEDVEGVVIDWKHNVEWAD